MSTYTITIQDRVYVCRSDDQLVTLHTSVKPEKMAKVKALVIGQRSIPVVQLRATTSAYFTDYHFYEFNFKPTK